MLDFRIDGTDKLSYQIIQPSFANKLLGNKLKRWSF